MHGRIEELTKPGSHLPADLTTRGQDNDASNQLLDSKDEWAKPDTKALTAKPQNNTGFPSFVIGRWGGKLKVMSRVIDIPDRSDTTILPGEVGFAVFRFVNEANRVDVRPTTVFFTNRKATPQQYKYMRSSDDSNTTPSDYDYFPVIDVGAKHWKDGVGSAWDDKVVHNSFEMLTPNCGEEDVVFERSLNGDLYGYRESVVRFTWRDNGKGFAKIAVADYTLDRKPRKYTVMAGFISQNWLETASFITGLTHTSWADVEEKFGL